MKKFKRGIALLCALLCTSLLLVGCGDQAAMQMAKTVKQMESLQSVDYRAKITVDMNMLGQSASAQMDMQGSEFMEPLRAASTMTVNANGAATSMQVYAEQTGDTFTYYMNADGSWVKDEMSAEEFNAILQQSYSPDIYLQYLSALKSFSALGEETIEGTPALKYQGVLSGDDLTALLKQSMASTLGEQGSAAFDLDSLIKDLDDLAFQLWVDPATNYLLRMDIDMGPLMQSLFDSLMSGMGLQLTENAMRVNSMTISMNFQNFNNATEFTIPDEAKNAATTQITGLGKTTAA